MRARTFFAVLAVAALLAVPASAQRARRTAPAAARDWSHNVVRTPEGVRMGNPAAPVKLIEYGSITCGHCALFSEHGAGALRDRYIRSGRVSWEYRPYLLFPTDPGVFLLLNCLSPDQFFSASEQLYATQRAWTGPIVALPAAEAERLVQLPPAQQAAAMIRVSGLDRFFRERGLSPARIGACLNDPAALNRLGEISSRAANELGVNGTPTFFINGRLVRASDWARLEPMLAGR